MRAALKSFIYFISSTIFRLLLVALFNIVALQLLFGDASYIKSLLSDTRSYERFVPAVLASNATQSLTESATLTLGSPEVSAIAESAFTPEDIRRSTDTVIDASYLWLEQETPKISFSLDYSTNKAAVIDGLANLAYERLSVLPKCGKLEQISAIDPFSAACIPSSIDLNEEKSLLTTQYSENLGFLDDPVVTDATLLGTADADRFDARYIAVPKIFNYLTIAPYIIVALLALLGYGQVLLFKKRRRGIQKLGHTLLGTSFGIIFFGVIYTFLLPRYTGSLPLFQSSTQGIDGLISELGVRLGQDFTIALLYSAVPSFLIGIGCVVAASMITDTLDHAKVVQRSGVVSSEQLRKKPTKVQSKKPPIQSSDIPDKKTTRKKSKKYRTIPKKEL